MDVSGKTKIGRITLDDLHALNQELLTLTRAGVPLEPNLRRIAEDVPGRLGTLSQQLSDQISRGIPLSKALRDLAPDLPELYSTVLEVGEESSNISSALEVLVTIGRRLTALRRTVSNALIYPLAVVLIATVALVCFLSLTAPAQVALAENTGLAPNRWLVFFTSFGRGWWWIAPIGLCLLAAAWLFRLKNLSIFDSSLGNWWSMGVLSASRHAAFADVLAVLVGYGVPMPRALRCASRVVGDRNLTRLASQRANEIESGDKCDASKDVKPDPSPLFAWAMGTVRSGTQLSDRLRFAGRYYNDRVEQRLLSIQLWLPVVLTILLGVTCTVAYAAIVLGPWFEQMRWFAEHP